MTLTSYHRNPSPSSQSSPGQSSPYPVHAKWVHRVFYPRKNWRSLPVGDSDRQVVLFGFNPEKQPHIFLQKGELEWAVNWKTKNHGNYKQPNIDDQKPLIWVHYQKKKWKESRTLHRHKNKYNTKHEGEWMRAKATRTCIKKKRKRKRRELTWRIGSRTLHEQAESTKCRVLFFYKKKVPEVLSLFMHEHLEYVR